MILELFRLFTTFFGIFESYRRLNTKLRTVTVGSIVDESEEGINMC